MVTLLEASNINLRYGSQKILNNVNVSIHSGKITALIGPNGAGKSSLFRVLAGLVKPDSAYVQIDGKKLNNISELRRHCGYMLETPDFYNYLSALKNLELIIGLTNSKADAGKLLETVGLSEAARKKVQHYSKGMKQRLGFAQTMTEDPDFYILDEPFNGLDPEVKEQMLKYLISLKEKGKGIIISTHLLEEIENIASDFILLNKGNVFWKGNMQDHNKSCQNVTLYFSKPIPNLTDTKFELNIFSNQIRLSASIQETEELLNLLHNMGLIPYRIDRSSILHDKYMEIAE